MAERHAQEKASLAAGRNQPLIGIILPQDGQDVTHYFADETDADAMVGDAVTEGALLALGSWSDFDWEETLAELDRIRHESIPTPPVDQL